MARSQREPVTGQQARELVGQLVHLASKTLLETQRLRRDIAQLNARIEPVQGTLIPSEPEHVPETRNSYPIPFALDIFARARDHLLACERELSAIRSRIDVIESDAVSREDMKPWIRGTTRG
jgi:hypothetical protein